MQSHQTQATIEYLPRNIAEILIGDIRRTMPVSLSDRTDEAFWIESGAFRSEQFCRRVVGAEYGCQTSIQWAIQYYEDLVEEARDMMQQDMNSRLQITNRDIKQTEQALISGTCSNPRFQLFLDTLEDPQNVMSLNAAYMGWIGLRVSEYKMTAKTWSFDEFLKNFVEQRRSQLHLRTIN